MLLNDVLEMNKITLPNVNFNKLILIFRMLLHGINFRLASDGCCSTELMLT